MAHCVRTHIWRALIQQRWDIERERDHRHLTFYGQNIYRIWCECTAPRVSMMWNKVGVIRSKSHYEAARLPIPSTLRLHAVSCDNDRYKVAFWLIQETRMRRAARRWRTTHWPSYSKETRHGNQRQLYLALCHMHIYTHKAKAAFSLLFARVCCMWYFKIVYICLCARGCRIPRLHFTVQADSKLFTAMF